MPTVLSYLVIKWKKYNGIFFFVTVSILVLYIFYDLALSFLTLGAIDLTLGHSPNRTEENFVFKKSVLKIAYSNQAYSNKKGMQIKFAYYPFLWVREIMLHELNTGPTNLSI
jgi:hypothetical protein